MVLSRTCMGVSWPRIRTGALPAHYSLLPAVSQVKRKHSSHPLGQLSSGLRPLECFARSVWDVGLEDMNNDSLLVLAKIALPSTTLKPDKGSTEGPAFTL